MLRLHHIAIAVTDIAQALPAYTDGLGLSATHIEDVPVQGARVALIPLGETNLELVAPLAPDCPLARSIERRGEGVHHLCFEVDDIVAELAGLKARGVRVVDETPRAGADGALVAFVHPSSTHGVLLELRQSSNAYSDPTPA